MPASVVQAQYDSLEEIAKRFDEQADNTETMARHIIQMLEQLEGGGWEGDSAQAFFREMNDQVIPTTNNLRDAFAEAGETSREIVRVMQTAEEEAANQFNLDNKSTAGFSTASAFANASSSVSILGSIFKGIAADNILPRQYRFVPFTPDASRGKTTVAAVMDMLAGKKGRGLPLIRFDGPHKGSPTPHINLYPKLTRFSRPTYADFASAFTGGGAWF